MFVATLFSVGFGATAVTTKPGPSVLVLMFAFALMGGGPLPYSLGIFMGALAASLLGKPAQWKPVPRDAYSLALLVLYVMQLSGSERWGSTLFAAAQLLEWQLFAPDIWFSKAACYAALLAVCALVDATLNEHITHIYCCMVVLAGCWLSVNTRVYWLNLKNALVHFAS